MLTTVLSAYSSDSGSGSDSSSGYSSSSGSRDGWEKDNGKPAPRLMGSGWVGTPVSLDALRGNTVVIAFWNAM